MRVGLKWLCDGDEAEFRGEVSLSLTCSVPGTMLDTGNTVVKMDMTPGPKELHAIGGDRHLNNHTMK